MEVYIERENCSRKIDFSGCAKDLLKKLNINPETVIITKKNTLISEDEDLSEDDSIKILSVISGG